MRRTTPVLVAVIALLLAAPLAAYTIYLKDGRTLNIKGKPRIVNGRALVTLPNGTQASLDPTQIDEKKTEEMNQRDLGAAVIIDQGIKQQQATATPQPAQQSRLSDISARGVGPRDQPARRNPAAPGGSEAIPSSRAPYGDAAVASELSQFFLAQKAEGVEVFQGSQGRPLAQVTTSSETSVFRALLTGANALLQIRGRFPQKVDGLEMVMVTPAGERAGQFTLTPDMAEDLVAKRVGLVSFFLNNVQF
ncbi:MAG: hypothetical protein QOH06_4634 [Acidobacteriota bacterium]|jgi:hypothetical protein|nr:hypothetical protein [Acidobacteriota bacterium]